MRPVVPCSDALDRIVIVGENSGITHKICSWIISGLSLEGHYPDFENGHRHFTEPRYVGRWIPEVYTSVTLQSWRHDADARRNSHATEKEFFDEPQFHKVRLHQRLFIPVPPADAFVPFRLTQPSPAFSPVLTKMIPWFSRQVSDRTRGHTRKRYEDCSQPFCLSASESTNLGHCHPSRFNGS